MKTYEVTLKSGSSKAPLTVADVASFTVNGGILFLMNTAGTVLAAFPKKEILRIVAKA